MRARSRHEYLTRFTASHADTPAELQRALSGAFVESTPSEVDRAIGLVHGLQGTAAMLGLQAIHELGFALEQTLVSHREAFGAISAETRLAVLASVGMLDALIADATQVAVDEPLPPATAELVSRLGRG